MRQELIDRAVLLGNKSRNIFIATSDKFGLPHVAAAGRISLESERMISASEWFCPGTLANLHLNPLISVVVWDPEYDVGWQILGDCRKIEDLSVMDGYTPGMDEKAALPQVERKIYVHVNKVLHFSRAPHSDLAE